jgi:hypothetical protein
MIKLVKSYIVGGLLVGVAIIFGGRYHAARYSLRVVAVITSERQQM